MQVVAVSVGCSPVKQSGMSHFSRCRAIVLSIREVIVDLENADSKKTEMCTQRQDDGGELSRRRSGRAVRGECKSKVGGDAGATTIFFRRSYSTISLLNADVSVTTICLFIRMPALRSTDLRLYKKPFATSSSWEGLECDSVNWPSPCIKG